MRLTRLYLRNYRVYEDPLELELPPGLVGIYGPNGAGKSALMEMIRFALFGRTRTANDEVRTSGVHADCVAEVEFEHEGHLYLVRRILTGAASSVRASAHADGAQVAEGARDTSRYVHSVLGMDDAAFRASVFAEQKQLAAFSQHAPHERRKLVLQLLGITPLDAARDDARKQAKAAHDQFDHLRSMLPDLDELRRQVAESQAAADALFLEAQAESTAAAAAQVSLDAAAARRQRLDGVRQEHDLLVAELGRAAAERDRSAAAAARLTAELAELEAAAHRVEALAADAEGWREAEAELRRVEAVVTARLAVAEAPVPPPPPPLDEDGCEAARSAADSARARLAGVGGGLEGAGAERERAAQALARSGELDGAADCPLCGQALGGAFAQVQAHRAAELAAAEARVAGLEAARARLAAEATVTARDAKARVVALGEARAAWEAHRRAVDGHERARRALAAAEAALGRPVAPDERPRLAAEVDRRRRAADECHRLGGRLERRGPATAELDVERLLHAEHGGRVATLQDKVAGLGFRPPELVEAVQACERLSRAARQAAARADAARLEAAQARTRAEAEARRLADAEGQHARLAELSDDARHRARTAELLNAFRNAEVATVGPRLSGHAAALFGELTDHEYDRLDVDPETFEIRVRDAGVDYGMARFSGSETDLANLALRVAISEQVRFQAGGAVGLLVLDEVFGPLDDDRKDRMLLALERLRGRFRQVLVVTHDTAIKHQLPHAVEVVKLPGRRATARLVEAQG